MGFRISRKKGTRIIVCPKCLKPTLVPAFNVSGWLANDMYRCKNPDCNYIGYIYLEYTPEEAEKLFIKHENKGNGQSNGDNPETGSD